MNKKSYIKIGIIIAVICMVCFCSWTFAETSVSPDVAGEDELKGIAWLLNFFVGFISWGWVLLAKLAGTFLSNRWVYGEVIGLDSLLWKYWNLMKNLANFGLGFYLIFILCKGLISNGKGSILSNLKSTILWIFIAGVGIQVSWFFTAAVIDVSTITLAAVGSFPSQVVADNPVATKAIKNSMENYVKMNGNRVVSGTEVTFLPLDSAATSYLKAMDVELVSQELVGEGVGAQDIDYMFDKIMPNANDVAGPLYFMGYSILNTQRLTSINNTDNKGLKETILNTILQGGTTIVYSIEMLVLCVLALMRIIYLWIFIILSPFVILLWCIEKGGQKISGGKDNFLGGFTKQLNLKSFFLNVFKPTIIVLGLGMAVMFTSLMSGVIVEKIDQKFDIGGITVSSTKDATSNTNGNKGDQTYTTTMDLGVLRFTLAHAGKTFLQIILSIITVFIVYLIIMLAVKMGSGKDFVSDKIGKLQDTVTDVMGSVPIVPVTRYDKQGVRKKGAISAGALFGSVIDDNRDSLASRWLENVNRTQKTEMNAQADEVLKLWGIRKGGGLNYEQRGNIEHALTTGNKGKGQLLAAREIIVNNGITGMNFSGRTEDSKYWMNQFSSWLKNMNGSKMSGTNYDKDWDNMIEWRNNKEDGEQKTIENLFKKDPKYIKAYADMFVLGEIKDWGTLKEADIKESSKSDDKA